MRAVLDAPAFTGRSAAQVDEFLAEVAAPILESSPATTATESLRV